MTDSLDHAFDVAGQKVKVGDQVAVPRKGYRNLVLATVVKITNHKFRVEYKHPWRADDVETYTVDHDQTARINVV